MLLWQVGVATIPHVFVIATWIWSDEIIYLLVSCNKQLFLCIYGARHVLCLYTCYKTMIQREEGRVKMGKIWCLMDAREKLLITTYQEVNDLIWSYSCCDDENVRDGGNTDLPEQYFLSKTNMKSWEWDIFMHNKSIVIRKYNCEALCKIGNMNEIRTPSKESKGTEK